MKVKPLEKEYKGKVDVSFLCLPPGHYVHINAGEYDVEIICQEDGALQICADDKTLASGIHRFKDIYGPDPFKGDET